MPKEILRNMIGFLVAIEIILMVYLDKILPEYLVVYLSLVNMKNTQDWFTIFIWAVGILLPAVGILSLVLFNMLLNRINRLEEHVQQRLQSLVHEDRDIQQQITGIYHLMVQIQKDCVKTESKKK